jgi:hypothetical protein
MSGPKNIHLADPVMFETHWDSFVARMSIVVPLYQ